MALGATVAVFAQQRPPPRIMSVDELRPGMTGYGLTVFQGMRPERFSVEVVGVLHNARPRMDMILIRPSHPRLEVLGTVAGMSGSPIYINDRLVGAYAYGWEFGRETIAGVTPIANMLAEARRPRRTPPGLIPGSQVPLPLAVDSVSGRRSRSVLDTLAARMQVVRAPVPSAHGQLVPVSVPLCVAGMSEGALRYLSEAFEPFGLVPIQSGGTGPRNGSPPADAPAHFENGGSISVTLISGDISGAATGTVTWVQDHEVLAFGHPMMGLGEVALPTALSRVAWIMASLRRSHKMAEPVRDLGAMVQDRPAAIVVDERASAPMIPVRVRLHGVEGAPQREWNVQLAYHRAFLSRLVGAVLGTVLETTAGDVGDAAWVVRSSVVTRDHGTLQFTDHGAAAEGVNALSLSSLSVAEAIDRLTDNPFEQVRIDRIDAEVELRWSRDFYYIRSVALSRAEVDPGETVQLLVSLGQYGARPVVRAIPVTVPREVAGREMDIEVSAGGETLPDLAEPENITDLIRNVTSSFAEDALVVTLRMPGQGVLLRGRALPNLPGSALDALRPAANTDGGEPIPNVRRIVVPVGRLVLGRDRVRLRVREVRQ